MKISLSLPKRKKTFQKEKVSVNLNLCWSIVLYSFFIIVLLSFVFGYYLYLRVNRESFFNPPPGVSDREKKQAELEEALNYFQNREEISNQIISTPSPVIDPSR